MNMISSKKVFRFKSPGRTEIIGNHTDHNGGLVIGAAVDFGTEALCSKNNSTEIRIDSVGYQKFSVDISEDASTKSMSQTEALVKGIVEGTRSLGFAVGGFDAQINSNLISGAGLSSSASFEMLIVAAINSMFNDDKICTADCARIGQYAENHYWGKASGLMDQLVCANGGTVFMDFSKSGSPLTTVLTNTPSDLGLSTIIVNSGGQHDKLIDEYSAIPNEMALVAGCMGVSRLCEGSREMLFENEKKINNDRAFLRALHFYDENDRVLQLRESLSNLDRDAFLEQIKASGRSSWMYLQNCFAIKTPLDQKLGKCLAISDSYFSSHRIAGASRVHGGGFAGTTVSFVSNDWAEDYIAFISEFVGKENVFPIKERREGACEY